MAIGKAIKCIIPSTGTANHQIPRLKIIQPTKETLFGLLAVLLVRFLSNNQSERNVIIKNKIKPGILVRLRTELGWR